MTSAAMFVLWISAAAIFEPDAKVSMSYPGHFPTAEACEAAGNDYMARASRLMERVYDFKCVPWDQGPLGKSKP